MLLRAFNMISRCFGVLLDGEPKVVVKGVVFSFQSCSREKGCKRIGTCMRLEQHVSLARLNMPDRKL